jgi:hypothetical protein
MKTSFNWNTRALRWAGSFALVAAIAACGGGGGDGGVPPPILDPVNNANAVDDVFPAIQSAAGGTTTSVQTNDTVTINGSTTAAVLGTNASIAAVTRTSAAPAAGSIALNTSTGVITVAAGTSAGAYAFSYQLCRTAPSQTVCDVATASGSVTVTPPASNVVTRADVLACPVSGSLINATTWSNCLVGKIFVGRDLLNSSQACELRVLANSTFELVHNGITYNHLANSVISVGLYQNTTNSTVGPQIFAGVLGRSSNASGAPNQLAEIQITVDLNGQDTIEAKIAGGGTTSTINCTINNI